MPDKKPELTTRRRNELVKRAYELKMDLDANKDKYNELSEIALELGRNNIKSVPLPGVKKELRIVNNFFDADNKLRNTAFKSAAVNLYDIQIEDIKKAK